MGTTPPPDFQGDASSNVGPDGQPLVDPSTLDANGLPAEYASVVDAQPKIAAPYIDSGVPFYRPLLIDGDHGYGVHALQLEMHSQLGTHATNTKNSYYDKATANDVAAFYKAHGYNGDPNRWDDWGWDTVAPQVVHQPIVMGLLALAKAHDVTTNMRSRIVNAALFGYAHRLNIHYAEVRPMPPSLAAAATQVIETDCSGFDTLCYKMAGAVDPNGRGYDGYGYTGTLWPRGKPVTMSQLQPGDLCFYGYQAGNVPSHTAVYIGNGLVVSNGRYPMDKTAVSLGGALPWRGGRSYI